MKIRQTSQIFNSTLSCILKCLKSLTMIHKKIIFSIFALSFITGCSSPTAMLGPAYTFTSTGNVFRTGLSYGSSEMISMHTGKTPIENVKEITLNQKNIQKKTLESEDFYYLVKNKIEKTGAIINNVNQ